MSIKQVIVVRKDLNMRKGKIAGQVAHAAMAFITDAFQHDKKHWEQVYDDIGSVPICLTGLQYSWLDGNYRKIVAYVESEEALVYLQAAAEDAGVAAYPIIDEGLTEFKEPTLTCCAFGPDLDEKLDPITGHLKLL